jgi:large subunit ribosomal protein L10
MRPEKQLLLDEIKDKMTGTQGVILMRYKKMEPNVAAGFRMDLMGMGSEFEVVKKRILVKAAEVSGYPLDKAQLEGHIGVVFADTDLLQTAKYLFKFRTDHDEVLDVIGARFEGNLYSGKDVEMLSKLPGKKEMQAQMLSLFEAVPSQLLATMEALLTSLGHCLNNKSET